MEYIVHHTCSNKGDPDSVTVNVPYRSEYKPYEYKMPFLGEGYYFWEFNKDYARYWGEEHYKNKYIIFEAEIIVDHEIDGYYLDLAGSRKDLVDFVDILMEFNLIHEDGTKGIDLCYIISYLRKNFPEEFPFKVIRAIDYKNNEKVGIKIDFNGKGTSYTMLNPRMIISFMNKSDIVYKTKPFIIFAS